MINSLARIIAMLSEGNASASNSDCSGGSTVSHDRGGEVTGISAA